MSNHRKATAQNKDWPGVRMANEYPDKKRDARIFRTNVIMGEPIGIQ